MRQFDIEAANKWLTENWDVIKSQQYIDVIKKCLEKATENNQYNRQPVKISD